MLSQSLSGAPAWFTACAADNTREFWTLRRDDYHRTVREPFLALLSDAGQDVQTWRVYRPHRDTRFSPGVGPLKTFLGALCVATDGTGRYAQIDARGLLASSGLPYLAADQLKRWRTAVAGQPGEDITAAIEAAQRAGASIKSGYPEPLRRVPRGVDPNHPRADLLRWKGIEAWDRLAEVDDDPAGWLLRTWDAGGQLCRWLAHHVGATSLERTR